jgi:para-nitrobenzyl esterase
MITKQRFLVTIFFVFIISLFVQANKKDNISVNAVSTINGFLSGIYNADKTVMIFKGIPFAAPPVGELRWKEPQPVKSWEGIRKAENFGPNAVQSKPIAFGVYTDEFLIPKGSEISEDCLYLNVWSNAKSTRDKKLVIVYIHGGGFMSGSGSVPIYDGEAMAKKGIVFVTINYRQGLLGFFSHPELTKESQHKASGNYGILDQIAALKWVNKNIAAFGGDSNNITIAGQSAGSMSVNILNATPLAKGLYHRMIAESGANVVPSFFGDPLSLDAAEKKGLQIQKLAGVENLEELRRIPAERFVSLLQGLGTINIDGYVLTEPIASVYALGKQTKVPLLTGYTGNDNIFPALATLPAYKKFVAQLFPMDTTAILKYYPASNDDEAKLSSFILYRDMSFGVQNYAWACRQSEDKKTKVFMYYFNRKVPEYGGKNQFGAFHSSEVPYAYDNLKFFNRPLEGKDQQLSEIMSAYWAEFAKKGDPNKSGLPLWPSFTREKGEVMIFGEEVEGKEHPYLDALEFLYQKGIR